MTKRIWLPVVIVLIAAALRLVLLSDVPPGMTHDEADHGLDAWGVVNGIRPIYFTVGYGREPLFDYSTAVLMSFLGPTFLAGRLTAAFFSLIMLAGSYAWVRRAFNHRIALMTLTGCAFSFWAVMTGRHALRTVTMPALFALSVASFWYAAYPSRDRTTAATWRAYGLAGLLMGITFYSYMPARIMWLLFPAQWVYWLLFDRERARQTWRGTLLVLMLAAAVGAPLFIYLQTTGAEVRLSQLSGPLNAARAGDFAPLWANVWASLRLFTVEGDALWRYNIPGRPFLTPLFGWLFYVGLALALWYALRRPASVSKRIHAASALALIWLVGGAAPALITGPEASMTRAIALLPVLYLFPALTLDTVWCWVTRSPAERPNVATVRFSTVLLLTFFFLTQLSETMSAYFVTWANAPEVRVQYEQTLVAAINYLNDAPPGVAAISSPSPDRFHDPSTALMTLRNDGVSLRWFNGLSSLLLPQDGVSTLIFSDWAALNPALAPYVDSAELQTTLPLRDDDLNRPLTIYSINGPAVADVLLTTRLTPVVPVTFDQHVTLLGYEWLQPPAQAGDTVQLATLWRAEQPLDGVVLFTHVLAAPDQPPLAQADRLDVPSYFWQPGDIFVQLHTVTWPAGVDSAEFLINVGAYTQPAPGQFQRLNAVQDGVALGDAYTLTTIEVAP